MDADASGDKSMTKIAADKKASRSRLSAAFHSDLLEDWLINGKSAIARVREKEPVEYCKLIGNMVKTIHIEASTVDEEMIAVRTREELIEMVRERGGDRAVAAFNVMLEEHPPLPESAKVIELRPNKDEPPPTDS